MSLDEGVVRMPHGVPVFKLGVNAFHQFREGGECMNAVMLFEGPQLVRSNQPSSALSFQLNSRQLSPVSSLHLKCFSPYLAFDI